MITPADVSRAQDLLRRRSDLSSALSSAARLTGATVTVAYPRSGLGNDRMTICVDMPMEDALRYIGAARDRIDQQLRALGVEPV